MIGRRALLALTLGLAASAAAPAQPPAVPAQPPAPAGAEAPAAPATESRCCTIPADTPVEIEITELMTSMHSRTGQMFAIRLAGPILVDGREIVPAGIAGVGEVVHAARGGTISNSPGELILAARYLDFSGIRIPLHRTGYARSGPRGSWMIIPSVGLMLGPGGGVRAEPGTRVRAAVRGDVPLPAR